MAGSRHGHMFSGTYFETLNPKEACATTSKVTRRPRIWMREDIMIKQNKYIRVALFDQIISVLTCF